MSQSLDDRVVYLLKQYIAGTCTLDEFNELLALVSIQPNGSVLEELLLEEIRNSRFNEAEQQVKWHQMLQTVLQQQEVAAPPPVRAMRVFSKIAIAATVMVCMGLIAWWWLQKKQPMQGAAQQVATVTDIMPGRNGAILTLQNGQQLTLDSAGNGSLTNQPGLHIIKHDSLIAYAPATAPLKETVSFNTLTTPAGRKFQLVLSDGTRVWLNAASSIRYPAVFTGKERVVDVTGEVYFEVAKNASHPFIVNILSSRDGEAKGRVEVLGTHFNINDYDDEPLSKVTLLEGRVKVINEERAEGRRQKAENANEEVILKPGEQATLSHTSQLSQPIPVQTDVVMAWKNGYFQFERADIQTVMRQVARWYDVDIQYKGTITTDKFGGSIPRDATLSQVLHALEQSLVHFTIQGKKVIVTP